MTGALIECVCKGPQDNLLTAEPTVSFFQSSYAQYTPFSRESVELTVSGQIAFGQTMIVPLNKRGDLLGKIYLVFKLPGIRHKSEACSRRKKNHYDGTDYSDTTAAGHGHGHHGKDHSSSSSSSSSSSTSSSYGSSSYDCGSSCLKSAGADILTEGTQSTRTGTLPHKFVYWGNSIAHLIVDYVAFQIGGQDVDRQYGEWMECWDEFTMKPGKPTDELVGRYQSEYKLWKASRKCQTRYCPLRFFFCEHIGKALPILAIHYSNVRLQVRLRDLHECYYSNDGSIPYLIDANQELCPRDIKVQVFADVFYLGEEERDQFNEAEHEYLITQNQFNGGLCIASQSCMTNAPVLAKLPFQHPVLELIWTIQSEKHIKCKDFFNWAGENYEDPLVAFKLTINNHDRFQMREGAWFRLIEPLQSHTNIPKRHIYCYSFALFPEDSTFPSGSLNFSRLDDVTMHLVLQRGLGPAILKVWAQNFNCFRILGGLAGLAFVS